MCEWSHALKHKEVLQGESRHKSTASFFSLKYSQKSKTHPNYFFLTSLFFLGPARSLFLLQCPVFLLYVPTSPCFSPCFFAFDPEESIGSQFEKLKLINCLFEGVERDKRAGMPGLTDPKPPRCLHRLKDERATPPSWGWEPQLWGSLSPWGRDFTKIRACFDWKGIFFSPEDLYT